MASAFCLMKSKEKVPLAEAAMPTQPLPWMRLEMFWLGAWQSPRTSLTGT